MWFLDHVRELQATSQRPRMPRTATAYLVAPPVGGRAMVRLWDGEPALVPAQPGVYSGIATVQVQVDERGRPVYVYGPTTPAPVPAPEKPPVERDDGSSAPPDSPEAPKVTTRSTTIYVANSGTYSARFGSWGSWGGSWQGHPYSAGQGSISGSGALIGAGFYGSAVSGLGASSITRARVRIVGARQGFGWTPVVRLITNGSRPSGAPSYASSETATGPSLSFTGSGWVELTSGQREALRTGAARGVALVGSTYGVSRGKGTDGLAISLTYEVTS